MDKTIYTITSKENENVFIHAMQGHFVTASSHLNYYVGTSDVKHNHDVSTEAAKILARYYHENNIEVDTVLCLYETQVLGAYLAHQLSRPTMLNPNPNNKIYVISPEYDSAGNIIYRDNIRKLVKDKNIIVLISAITTGRTVERAMESIEYYGGKVAGVSAVFSVLHYIGDVKVTTIFHKSDLPGYETYHANDCPYCKAGAPVEGVSNAYGYSMLDL
ncbi:MAG: orotate phosphoribosyltransferase [Eubacterium sp.]|nr:orotate phosphoribosyltransferase [Eubacterium sp.]